LTINPISFTQEVNKQFIRYQLTAFPLSDPDLSDQAKNMLSQSILKDSPLFKGPYLSLARTFAEGEELKTLANHNKIHPAIEGIIKFPRLFLHQQRALEAVQDDKHCLITTGTGSGKTEAFLIPILDYCFKLRDSNAHEGIVAIILYPMNALATDQLIRLRTLLAGTGVTFGMYVGSTPQTRDDLVDTVQMQKDEGVDKFSLYYERYKDHKGITIAPWEERLTREEIAQSPPRILLTNVNQLEFLLTRGKDIQMFLEAPLRFIVLDEAHTYTGARGAEVALLLRRIRSFCGKSADEVICIATSATIVDPRTGDQPGPHFMNRLFGIDSSKVETISEEYEEVIWPSVLYMPKPIGNASFSLFPKIINAINNENSREASDLSSLVLKLTGQPLDNTKHWQEALFFHLKANQLVKAIYEVLTEPIHLEEAAKRVFDSVNRPYKDINQAVSELLCYLALGAAADNQGSLLRPKLHYFVRGLRGAVSIFLPSSNGETKAELFFTADKAIKKYPSIHPSAIFPILVCVNCGQHYFETWLESVDSEKTGLNGGLAEGDNKYWPRVDEEEGVGFIFTNNFVCEETEKEDLFAISEKLDKKRTEAFICRYCGTIHSYQSRECSNPQCRRKGDLLKIFVIDTTGKEISCPSCRYRGRRSFTSTRGPFRPLRAVTVADVHILAQDLINFQEPEHRKLIIFSDNRQDAAFQAAWMAQRARRYRFRHLMYLLLNSSPTPMSISDLTDSIFNKFEMDSDLARTLAPEVFSHESEEAYSSKLQKTLRDYIRIQILLEITMSMRARDSLESWGIMKVDYFGLSDNSHISEIRFLSKKFNLTFEEMRNFLENLLDIHRRNRHLYDDKCPIFSQYWHYGNKEIQRGFIPDSFASFSPTALKLTRELGEKATLITALYSERGLTFSEDFALKIGISKEQLYDFLKDIWELLTKKLNLLSPVTLRGSKGRPIGKVAGVYQINSSKLGLKTQYKRYRCSICQRIHSRATPKYVCTSYRCKGKLIHEMPPEGDYNIHLLNREFVMLITREHTAQVPAQDRMKIEEQFKNPESGLNCLVSTPTLELGVDIGDLDVVLLRNVPPLPANYWQRAGRAGRRHRMAVIYTYCRKSIHDEYFFEDPLRILSEKIEVPRFNLRNNVMIQKHVNAIILSYLSALKYKKNKSHKDERILNEFTNAFPAFISDILFEKDKEFSHKGSRYRITPFELTPFQKAFEEIKFELESPIFRVFQDYWPIEAIEEVEDKKLRWYISNFVDGLRKIYLQLYNQLMWTIVVRNRILEKEKEVGTLEEFDRKLLKRCRDWLRNIQQPSLDSYTLTVLSQMGFLPTYGTSSGNIIAFAGYAFSTKWQRLTFQLNRSPQIALYEYAPGNLIYANGGKYRNALLHLPVGDETVSPDEYVLDTELDRIYEKGRLIPGYTEEGLISLKCIPISDIELSFLSQVTDEENYRFRMPSYIVGYRQTNHRGGTVYKTGDLEFVHYRGQRIRLINVGPASKKTQKEFGFPICIVCGATRSPYASKVELEHFIQYHGEKTCKIVPEHYGLSADVEVDGLLFKGFESKIHAINFAESIRIGASILLEMDREDLKILLLPQSSEDFNIFVYDQMAGGSGLLDQIIERWTAICEAALEALDCSNQCLESCYRCMKTYRNMTFHKELNRMIASQLVRKFNQSPKYKRKIQPQIKKEQTIGESTNLPELRLRELLIKNGFPVFDAQKTIPIDAGRIRQTSPDLYYENPVKGIKIAIYLDGLSKNIHGNIDRRKTDYLIRITLKRMGYKVIDISASTLDDPQLLDYVLEEISEALNREVD